MSSHHASSDESDAGSADEASGGGGGSAMKKCTPQSKAKAKKGPAPPAGTKVLAGAEATEDAPMMITVMDRPLEEEVLLVAQNIGTVDEDGDIVPGMGCKSWLVDLQKLLNRDDPDFRHVATMVNSLNIVPKILVPIVKGCKADKGLVMTAMKIFLLLSKVRCTKHIPIMVCLSSAAMSCSWCTEFQCCANSMIPFLAVSL